MSLTAVAGWDLISPRTATAPRTKPSEHNTKHIKNVKDQTCALYTTSLSVYLSIHLLYRTISLSTSMPLAAFFAFLSLSLYGTCFLLLGSRKVRGTEGGSRTHRDGAYLSVLRLRWWRALRRSLRSVQPRCSQGAPTPSLLLSSVSIGVVLLASG